ncbi:hypothetical protein L2E82_29151 [Cichorium intybus]|uniref:Uncharacterized protein n=1 Tax=Cichorium intybus TaxID=13427 RepID=A0ACB9CXC6_CICIN|nr:hypothetical protein L2E82_29151 [Cichorium intybus]
MMICALCSPKKRRHLLATGGYSPFVLNRLCVNPLSIDLFLPLFHTDEQTIIDLFLPDLTDIETEKLLAVFVEAEMSKRLAMMAVKDSGGASGSLTIGRPVVHGATVDLRDRVRPWCYGGLERQSI